MSKKDAKKGDAAVEVNPTLRKVQRVLDWPGMLGWFGVIFGVASLWFFVSSLVLGSAADQLVEDSPSTVDEQRAAEVANGVLHYGFGDRLLYKLIRARRVDGEIVRAIPAPLKGTTRRRVQMAIAANARASWVFGLHTLFVAAFLWGLRLFEPAIRAEHEPPAEKKPAA